uniref:Uncharacterized protein n=1 Tax=Erwinia amylovora ATCC BAA-2158 TaxID=889211 RepID=E5B1P6_ERWAM|nr:hypothetical protein predicted by Glimmer/Critica [Erwinia amylovora ATCC BAA-2158]
MRRFWGQHNAARVLAGSGITVTWAVGHLLETAPPEA